MLVPFHTLMAPFLSSFVIDLLMSFRMHVLWESNKQWLHNMQIRAPFFFNLSLLSTRGAFGGPLARFGALWDYFRLQCGSFVSKFDPVLASVGAFHAQNPHLENHRNLRWKRCNFFSVARGGVEQKHVTRDIWDKLILGLRTCHFMCEF